MESVAIHGPGEDRQKETKKNPNHQSAVLVRVRTLSTDFIFAQFSETEKKVREK